MNVKYVPRHLFVPKVSNITQRNMMEKKFKADDVFDILISDCYMCKSFEN